MNIAIIPARSGSKRIPGKNCLPFFGKPMIAWSIETALQSKLFDHVVVSTDCQKIADTARDHGATAPFLRPAELADDYTPTIPVVRQAIEWLSQNGMSPKNVCCIYATAPFVQCSDLRRGLELLDADKDLDFAFPVTEFASSIFRGLKIENERVQMFWPKHELTRTQDLQPAFHDVGQFYWGTASAYRRHTGIYSARSAPIVIPGWRVQDIDTPTDWKRAEMMFPVIQAQIKAQDQMESQAVA